MFLTSMVDRLKKGLDAVTGDEVTDDSETDETNVRSRSFDAAPPGYVVPSGGGGGWLSGFLSSADTDLASASIDSAASASSVAGASGI